MKLKYCGLHSKEDVENAVRSSCDYLGFVFAKSKRQVDVTDVQRWLVDFPALAQQKVALFVHELPQTIVQIVRTGQFDIVQLHGNESVADVWDIRAELSDVLIWKVIHDSEHALDVMKQFEGAVDGYIVDQKGLTAWGGTGQSFDWSRVSLYQAEGERQGLPVMIAGGVNPDNIASLVRLNPDGIDISSGIESNGRKSKAKMKLIEKEVCKHDDSNNAR
ncbi:phosphoribosylanthranilate isomerase [Bacillus sp. JCM 19045]|nr:phosphoribosylanthranilate isomerase [Bacillus sp. JCM 19045]